jgi:hypothetical protein
VFGFASADERCSADRSSLASPSEFSVARLILTSTGRLPTSALSDSLIF